MLALRAWLAATAMSALQRRRGDLAHMRSLARLQRARGDAEGEELVLRMMVHTAEEVHGERHEETLRALVELGQLLASANKLEPAAHMYRRALEVHEQHDGWSDERTLHAALQLAHVCALRGQHDEADALYTHAELGYAHGARASRRLPRGGRDSTRPSTALLAVYHGQGALQQRRGRLHVAERKVRLALIGRELLLGASHADTLASVLQLASVLDEMGERDEADKLYVRASRGPVSSEFVRQASVSSSIGGSLDDGNASHEAEQQLLIEQRAVRATRYTATLEARRQYPTYVQGPVRHRVERKQQPRDARPLVPVVRPL